jgi:Endonuclease NucS
MPLAAWRIDSGHPERLSTGAVDLEANLETWIERDPGLIESGLAVVHRQMRVHGGPLDLLCVDLQGRATVVEVKRAKLVRDVVAQALDYAASVASMPIDELREKVRSYENPPSDDHPGLAALLGGPEDEREVAIVLVGVGQEPGLDRMLQLLQKFDMPIRAVTFDVFDVGDGRQLLIREEADAPTLPREGKPGATIEGVIDRAGGARSENGRRLRRLAEAAKAHGLYVKPFQWSLMFAPPQHKGRMLMTVWRWAGENELAVSYSATAFEEFFPVSADEVRQVFGSDEPRYPLIDDKEVDRWIHGLDQLFETIQSRAMDEPDLTDDVVEKYGAVLEACSDEEVEIVAGRPFGSRARLELKGATTVRYAYADADSPSDFTLRLYPGDTLEQARPLFADADRCNRLLALREDGWDVQPNFHFGFRASGLTWTRSALSADEYVRYWRTRIDGLAAIPRDRWDEELERLIADGIFARSDEGQFAADFRETERNMATPRPGLIVVRRWPRDVALSPDFPPSLRDALRDFLSALGEPTAWLESNPNASGVT